MTGCTVIVPVKPWRLSKSRLSVHPELRARLARAFALDLIEVVCQSSLVEQLIIVSSEEEMGEIARSAGAVMLQDRPLLSSNGLNEAIDAGRWWSRARRADAPTVVIPADLPALTTPALDETLDLLAPNQCAFVPDAGGRGTTLYWAATPALMNYDFGGRSASRHSDLGAHPVPEADPRARSDVDNALDLVEARRLGVGRHTEEALRWNVELVGGPATV
jgi:2-phospho-L-lactate guanylyltransferase